MAVPEEVVPRPEAGRLRPSVLWNLAMSAYWFATSFKWFILLAGGLMASKVEGIFPGGEKNQVWGLVFAFGAAEAMIGPIVFGYLSDRYCSRFGRRRPFIAIGAALTAIAVLIAAGANSIPMLVIAYLLLQISDDIGTAPYAALIPDLIDEEARGRASGIMALLQQLAQIVAAVVGLAFSSNPYNIFIVIAIINLICAHITFVTVKQDCYRKPEVKDGKLFTRSNWLDPWLIPDFNWVWFTRFLNSVGFYIILTQLLFYFNDRVKDLNLFGLVNFNEDTKKAQIVIALVISLTAAIGAVIAGKFADKIGRKKVIMLSGYIMFGALVPFAMIPNYSLIVLLSIAFGFGYGMYLSADWALVADILPNEDDFARDMGMWSMSVPLGQMLAGLSGVMITWLNRSSIGEGYTVAFLIAAVFFLLSTVLVKQIKGSF